MTLEQLKVIISADASGFNKEMSKVQKSLSGLNSAVSQSSSNLTTAFKGLKKALSATAIIGGLTTLSKKAVDVASDLVEVQNVVDTAFGSMASEVDTFAENAITQFGLSELAAKKYSSTLMAMGNSMQISSKSAKTMAVQLTGLASDLASFYNTDVDTAFNALEGIYTGNTRALRQYGVVLSDVELQQYATEKGITKSTSSMSGAEAATLRYNYVLEHTVQAQNDFAKTNQTWANSLKIVSNQMTELAGVVGTILKNVLTPFVNMLHLILQYAITAAKALASLFGISLNFSNGSSVEDLSDGWEDVAGSTDDATTAAKKYNKQLASFDEINNLTTTQSSSSGSDASSGGGGGFDVGSYFDDTNTALDNFKFDFNTWLGEVNEWLSKYEQIIASLGTTIGQKFNELVNYVDWDLLGNTIIKGLNELFTSINNFFNTADFKNFGTKIGDMINAGLTELDPSAWGQIMVNKLNAFFQTAYGFVSTLDWGLLGTRIQDTFRAALEAIDWNSISGTFIEGLNGLTTMLSTWVDSFPIQETINKLGKCLSDIIQGVDWKTLGESLNKLVTELIQGLKDIDYGEVTAAISEFLEGLDIVGIMVDWFSLKLDTLVEGIGGLLSTAQGWELAGIAIGGLLLKGFGSILANDLKTTFTVALLKGDVAGWFSCIIRIVNDGLSIICTQIKLIGTLLSPILTTIGQIVSAVAPFVALIAGIGVAVVEFVDQFQTGMDPVKMLIEGIGIAVAAIGAILLGAPAAITALIAAVVYLVSAVVLAIHDNWDAICTWWTETWQALCDWWTEIWQGVSDFFTGIIDGIKECFDGLAQKWDEIKQAISDKVSELKDNFSKKWDEIKQGASQWAQETGEKISDKWSETKEGVSTTVGNLGTALGDTWSDIKQGATDKATAIKEGVVEIFTKLKDKSSEIFNKLKDVIKKPINAVITFINDFMKCITNSLNKLFDSLNKIHISVPSWVPWIGGKSFGFSIDHISYNSIPALATGGIVSSPTLAMVGEYSNASSNPEVITPLDKLNSMLRTDETNSLLRELITVVDSKDFRAYISKSEVGKASVDYINSQSRIMGASPLKGAY